MAIRLVLAVALLMTIVVCVWMLGTGAPMASAFDSPVPEPEPALLYAPCDAPLKEYRLYLPGASNGKP
jgi:hypothetical protein